MRILDKVLSPFRRQHDKSEGKPAEDGPPRPPLTEGKFDFPADSVFEHASWHERGSDPHHAPALKPGEIAEHRNDLVDMTVKLRSGVELMYDASARTVRIAGEAAGLPGAVLAKAFMRFSAYHGEVTVGTDALHQSIDNHGHIRLDVPSTGGRVDIDLRAGHKEFDYHYHCGDKDQYTSGDVLSDGSMLVRWSRSYASYPDVRFSPYVTPQEIFGKGDPNA
jgi:hypothetical protein